MSYHCPECDTVVPECFVGLHPVYCDLISRIYESFAYEETTEILIFQTDQPEGELKVG